MAVSDALWSSCNDLWQCWYLYIYLELLQVFLVLRICNAPDLNSEVLDGS